MSYLRYLCLFTYSGGQHILCCVCLRLRLRYQFLWIVHFVLPLRYSLTSIFTSEGFICVHTRVDTNTTTWELGQ
jgi:hypothetical protein